jgi:hypothetical protein
MQAGLAFVCAAPLLLLAPDARDGGDMERERGCVGPECARAAHQVRIAQRNNATCTAFEAPCSARTTNLQ